MRDVKWTLGDPRIQLFFDYPHGTTTVTTSWPVNICGPLSDKPGYGYTHITAEWLGQTADSLYEWGQSPAGLQPVNVALQPQSASIVLGTTKPFKAYGLDQFSNQRDKTKSATWTSDNPSVASVGTFINPGLVSGLSRGVAKITANVNGTLSLAAPVTVRAVTSVVVTPASANVLVGTTLQLTASLRDQFGSPIDWPPGVAWTSSSPGIATVSASNGLVTGVAPGQVAISATAGGVTGTSTVTVLVNPTLTNLSTNPSPPVQYLPATYTIDGSAFDPATVEVVITNDLCDPYWGDCNSYIRNDQFRVKTSGQLVADNIAYSISGPYHLYVRNAGTGLRSPSVPFTIQPMYGY